MCISSCAVSAVRKLHYVEYYKLCYKQPLIAARMNTSYHIVGQGKDIKQTAKT